MATNQTAPPSPENTPPPDSSSMNVEEETKKERKQKKGKKENMYQQTTSLPTPEATPGPDSDQFKADKARQQAAEPLSQSKPGFDPPESGPSSPADSHMRGNESGEQTGSSSSSSPSSENNGPKEPKATYTKEQKKVVDDVLNFGSQEYHKILGLEDGNDVEPEEIEKAFKNRPLLTQRLKRLNF